MGKRKAYIEVGMGELIPQMKATEEQMRSGKRVILNGHRVTEVITPEQLANNYTELEAKFAKLNGGKPSGQHEAARQSGASSPQKRGG